MGFRERMNKFLGKDPVYSNVKRDQQKTYQTYFLTIVHSVNIANLTERAHSRPFNKQVAEKDHATIDQLANKAKTKDGLYPVILQIMVEQYLFADPWQREQDLNRWIYTVMRRKQTDYFPDALRVHNVLFKNQQEGVWVALLEASLVDYLQFFFLVLGIQFFSVLVRSRHHHRMLLVVGNYAQLCYGIRKRQVRATSSQYDSGKKASRRH